MKRGHLTVIQGGKAQPAAPPAPARKPRRHRNSQFRRQPAFRRRSEGTLALRYQEEWISELRWKRNIQPCLAGPVPHHPPAASKPKLPSIHAVLGQIARAQYHIGPRLYVQPNPWAGLDRAMKVGTA